MTIAILLVGFGNVARRFVQLIDESRAALTDLHIDPVIVGITTRRHGSQFDAAGIDATGAARRVASGAAIEGAAAGLPLEMIRRFGMECAPQTRVVMETTTLDIASGEPAMAHVRAGFAAGAHVITANKGPVAFAYQALADEAAAAKVSFLFEGAVMDGIPLFNLVRETLPAVNILGFRGVVNSTTNHIITAMERGEPFAAALARMQADGVAEADPSLDIDGWDAAAKTAALANVWLGANMTPRAIPREGIGPDTAARAVAACAAGRRLKLIAHASREANGVRAGVALQELESGDPLAALDGQGNALEIHTWPMGRIVITQRDGGLEKTAYALLSDLVTVAKRVAR